MSSTPSFGTATSDESRRRGRKQLEAEVANWERLTNAVALILRTRGVGVKVMRWYRRFFRREITERQLDAELRFHLDQKLADLVATGMAPEEARRRAQLEFGGLDQVKEECRDVGAAHSIETVLQDVRYGLRMLPKYPGFTAVAVITLALGIGANTAIFSVVSAVLLQPLPYKDPAHLVEIGETTQYMGAESGVAVSGPDFMEWRASSRAFEEMAASMNGGFDVVGGDVPEKIQGAYVSTNFFPLLGIQPLLGRSFRPEEGQVGQDRAVILSYGLWQQRFGSDPSLIGKNLRLNGESYEVVGVLPRSFEFSWGFYTQNMHRYDIWVPLVLNVGMLTDREFHPLFVVGRLKPEISLNQARSDMSAVARRIAGQYPTTNRLIGAQVISFHDQVVGNVRPALLMLLSAVGLVLLIACANIANLLLGRGVQRLKEISVRTAIGASRWRLIRQLLTENLLLAGLGGCCGLLLGLWGTRLLVSIIPPNVPRIAAVRVDREVWAFTALITLLTGAIFGLFPALGSTKPDLTNHLKEGFGALTSAPGGRRARSLLVVSEIALALVLLVGAGLLVESFWHLVNANLGFSPANLLTMKLALPEDRYLGSAQLRSFAGKLLTELRSLPGVRRAAIASPLPLSGMNIRAQYAMDRNPISAAGEQPEADYAAVSSEYFQAMGIPVLRGRAFSEQDTAESTPVLIVNSILGKQLWPGENPIGKRLTVFSPAGEVSRNVVGMVGEVKCQGLEEAAGAQMYVPYSQDPASVLYLALRTDSDPEKIARAVRFRVLGLDRNLPVEDLMRMEQRLSSLSILPRFYTSVLGSFAAFALLLAVVGVYGVVSRVVAQRTHEVGVRLALGATCQDVLELIVLQSLKPTLIGVAIGIVSALVLTRFLSSLLFGVKPTDLGTFAVASAILTAVGLLASYLPARRATKVDPMVALRYE